MNNNNALYRQDLINIEDRCGRIKKYCEEIINGDGQTLPDIKYSFDYVNNYVKNYDLEGSTFGNELKTKATQASEGLRILNDDLKKLASDLIDYCEHQRNIIG